MFAIVNPLLPPAYQNPTQGGAGLAYYIGQLWKTIVVLGGLAFLIFFIWGALNWIIAGGDKAKIDAAQKQMTNGLIGLVVLVVSFAVVGFIGNFLGFDLLNINWRF